MATKEEAAAAKEKVMDRFGDEDYTNGFALSKDPSDPESWVVAVGLKHAIPRRTLPREIDGVKIVTTVIGRVGT